LKAQNLFSIFKQPLGLAPWFSYFDINNVHFWA